MSNLENLDYSLFFLINDTLRNHYFTAIAPYWRNMFFWLPLYVFLITFIIQKYKAKSGIVLLGAIISIALSDTVSSKIIKPYFKRDRPCNQVTIQKKVHLLVPPSSGYSFPSSHAANHFALSFFLLVFEPFRKTWIKTSLIFWAASISLAQVYVGLHYPFDIFFGALLGGCIGWSISAIIINLFPIRSPEQL